MRQRTWRLALVISFVLGALSVVDGADRDPAALVLETSGSSQPPLRPYTEIAAGQAITLASGSRLVFLHYETCRAVRVVGGTLTLRKQDFMLTGGRTESDKRRPCAQRLKVERGTGAVGGLVLRSGPRPNLARRPSVVLVGSHASDFAKVRFAEDSTILLEAALDGPHFRWPAGTAPLGPNRQYAVTLIPRSPDAAPITLTLSVGNEDEEVPVVLTVD